MIILALLLGWALLYMSGGMDDVKRHNAKVYRIRRKIKGDD